MPGNLEMLRLALEWPADRSILGASRSLTLPFPAIHALAH